MGNLFWRKWLRKEYYMGLDITSDNDIIWTSGMQSDQMATNNTYQTQRNGAKYVISQFDSSGQREWTTYYGTDQFQNYNISGIKVNESGIYITGRVENEITPNSYFDTTGDYTFEPNSNEVYISKFDYAGNREWSRYITKGNGQNYMLRHALILANNYIYITFSTTSTDFGSENTSFPNPAGGNSPGILMKLSLQGDEEWTTYLPESYYGWVNNSNVYSDESGGVYVMGSTLASDNGFLEGFSQEIEGSHTFYVMKFNDTGNMLWGNYFGQTSNDERVYFGMVFYDQDIYFYGTTEGSSDIATEGTFQENTNGEMYNTFISKYTEKDISIIGFDSDKIIAFPNPTSSLLNLQLNDGVDFPIKAYIYNTLGQLVKSKDIHQTKRTFDLRSLNHGTYFLKLKSKEEIVTKKIIIE